MEPSSGEKESAAPAVERPIDERGTAVWRQWLSSMASDAEAALAAAIAYREMDAESRETLLSSLEIDAPLVDAPPVALYAPLLAVERDPERRQRLIEAIGEDIELARPRSVYRALQGDGPGGQRLFLLVIPLYLDFVQVLACSVLDGEFAWVKHDPIVGADVAPLPGAVISGLKVEAMPVKSVLDDLASTVLSHRRRGRDLPEALQILVDLLAPEPR